MKVEEVNTDPIGGRHCSRCGAMMIRSVAEQENSYDGATGEAKTRIRYQWKCPNDPFFNVFSDHANSEETSLWFLAGVLAVCLLLFLIGLCGC